MQERREGRPRSGGRLLVVRRKRLTSELSDARLRTRKEERAAGAEEDRRRARVAWIRAVSASLLPCHGCRNGTGYDRAPADARTSSDSALWHSTGALAAVGKR